jgi:hypothetical protein
MALIFSPDRGMLHHPQSVRNEKNVFENSPLRFVKRLLSNSRTASFIVARYCSSVI